MRLTVGPGRRTSGTLVPPGDKSIAHRWIILASIAEGRSELRGIPGAGDIVSSATSLAAVLPELRPQLEGWTLQMQARLDGGSFTSHNLQPRPSSLVLEGRGRGAIAAPETAIDCGNAGTTMRLLAGLLAPARGTFRLTGDESLRRRPMDRVAAPLRALGADVETTDGHAPITVRGRALSGVSVPLPVPSAQVKGAVLLAGLAADGRTAVVEPVPTRDHTERLLEALGCPVERRDGAVAIQAWQAPGFEGTLPGDISGALFPMIAAAASGGAVRIEGVGLNPTRTGALGVLSRMGLVVRHESSSTVLGEPVGAIELGSSGELGGIRVRAAEMPGIIDEVPGLAALAALADGESRFEGAGELRFKESDRLTAVSEAIRALGGEAAVERDDLVVAGGGLVGGRVDARGDHRLAMAFASVAPGTERGVIVPDASAASISFPGFPSALRSLGLDVEG